MNITYPPGLPVRYWWMPALAGVLPYLAWFATPNFSLAPGTLVLYLVEGMLHMGIYLHLAAAFTPRTDPRTLPFLAEAQIAAAATSLAYGLVPAELRVDVPFVHAAVSLAALLGYGLVRLRQQGLAPAPLYTLAGLGFATHLISLVPFYLHGYGS